MSDDMHGVFMVDNCKPGLLVHELSREETTDTPTRTSIEICKNLHVEDRIGIYMNHDCNPTCNIQGYKVIALKNMLAGDEVTFDYEENETTISSPFVCRCCGKLIGKKNESR
jgi:hypothetical protein